MKNSGSIFSIFKFHQLNVLFTEKVIHFKADNRNYFTFQFEIDDFDPLMKIERGKECNNLFKNNLFKRIKRKVESEYNDFILYKKPSNIICYIPMPICDIDIEHYEDFCSLLGNAKYIIVRIEDVTIIDIDKLLALNYDDDFVKNNWVSKGSEAYGSKRNLQFKIES